MDGKTVSGDLIHLRNFVRIFSVILCIVNVLKTEG